MKELSLVWLLKVVTACCNKALWKLTSAFSVPLHRLKAVAAVLCGKQPNGCNPDTTTFRTPSRRILCKLSASCFTTSTINPCKA